MAWQEYSLPFSFSAQMRICTQHTDQRSPGQVTGPRSPYWIFLSVTSMTGFGMYSIIYMQSSHLVKVRPLLQECRHITRLLMQNAFYLMKDGCGKCISVNGHCFDDE